MKDIEKFMLGFMFAFALTTIFWNIPSVMKNTYTYKDLVEENKTQVEIYSLEVNE